MQLCDQTVEGAGRGSKCFLGPVCGQSVWQKDGREEAKVSHRTLSTRAPGVNSGPVHSLFLDTFAQNTVREALP